MHACCNTIFKCSIEFNCQSWVIDIYSLIMAGLILPMGVIVLALKNYYLLELQFLVLSCGFFSNSLRVNCFPCGLGAAMLIPATLSGIRNAKKSRGILHLVFGLQWVVGFWSIGWWICTRTFPLGSLINIPIILVVLVMIAMIINKRKLISQLI